MIDQHKAIALNKIKKFGNPYTQPYPLWHITTLDRLRDVLTLGLISANYAKKLAKQTLQEILIALGTMTQSR